MRRIVEDTRRVNRRDLWNHWNMLKTAKIINLPYSEFRHLDMARTLVRKNTDECTVLQKNKESVREELKTSETTREHLAQQVSAWVQDTQAKLSEALGYDQLALAKEVAFVHPTNRVTAWFRCMRCTIVGGKHRADKSLTYTDVCVHRCPGRTKRERLKGAWNVEWFEPDQKVKSVPEDFLSLWLELMWLELISTQAIAAARELLRVCKLDERHALTPQLAIFGCNFFCKSCKDPIVMDASSVVSNRGTWWFPCLFTYIFLDRTQQTA